MALTDMRFKEIEHKFVVSEDFECGRFRQSLAAMKPVRHAKMRVRDRYFITEAGCARGFVMRHRFDAEIHELTFKSLGSDAEVRDEINLKLEPGDQHDRVDAFMAAQGIVWQGTLWKELEVWHFDDCEVVHYVATTDGKTVSCVEFEATSKPTLDDALAVLKKYEEATGFVEAIRTRTPLLYLLWPEARRLTLGA